MRVVLGIAATFGAFGALVGTFVFGLASLGVIELTGAAPGGVLSGFVGGVIAFGMHGIWGAAQSLLSYGFWVMAFGVLAGLLGAVRRRTAWWTPLALLAAAAVMSFAHLKGPDVLNWFGSVSRFDGAAYWGASLGVGISTLGQLPLWLTLMWRFTNSTRKPGLNAITDLSESARATGVLTYEDRVNILLQLLVKDYGEPLAQAADGITFLGMLAAGWAYGRWWGIVVALILGSIFLRFVSSIAALITGVVISLGFLLPIATFAAVWWREPDGVRDAILEQA